MHYANKVLSVDETIARIRNGSHLMLDKFVGTSEPACCIETLLANDIGQLTLITNTPGLRGGSLKAQLLNSGQLAEFIGMHVGTTDESTQACLTDSVRVAEFLPMGTWAEEMRTGAPGLGGTLVPVDVDILDQPGMFPEHGTPKQTFTVNGTTCFVEPPLRADVSIIRGWRADTFGNVEFRGTALQNQRDITMAGDYTIAEVNEVVEVGTIPPGRIGCPGVFVNAVVQGLSLNDQRVPYRHHWMKLGRLPTAET